MTLFSDIDWAILLVAAGFLLFGKDGRGLMRTAGRYYARAMRLKQELLEEVGRAADLPPGAIGAPASIRAAVLGLTAPPSGASGIPAAVSHPPIRTAPIVATAWSGAVGPETWSPALPTDGRSP